MSKKNVEKKSTIWVYAVVLFTSAFIVLLLTGYSQIKFNKNIDDYKYKILTGEKEKQNFQSSLTSALEENTKMKNDVKSLKQQLQSLNNKISDNNKQLGEYKNNLDKKTQSYESLISAQLKYNKGDIIGSALTIKRDCNVDTLGAQALESYKELSSIVMKDAASKLYADGYRKYKNKSYIDAIQSFSESFELVQDEYYSDDCLYLLALSEYKEGNIESAKTHANTLIGKHADSNYLQDTRDLLGKLNSTVEID